MRKNNLVLDDTLDFVARTLREHPEVSMDRLRDIADEVRGFTDVEATRLRILQLAGVAATAQAA